MVHHSFGHSRKKKSYISFDPGIRLSGLDLYTEAKSIGTQIRTDSTWRPAVSFVRAHTVYPTLSEPLFKLFHTLKLILTNYLPNECLRTPHADFAKTFSIRIPSWKPKYAK